MAAIDKPKKPKIKTSVLLEQDTYMRLGKRIALNKASFEGPANYSGVIELALQQYLDTCDELERFRDASLSCAKGEYHVFGD